MPENVEEPPPFRRVDPYALARNEALAGQLKRFYAKATVEPRDGAFILTLDGRPARTPARRSLGVPTREAAEMLAAEWNGQGTVIRPSEMPITRLVNSTLDGVADTMPAVEAEIVNYAGSDMLCYRADGPSDLVSLQAAAWDPVLAWARDALAARFYLAEGIVHVAQPAQAIAAVAGAVRRTVGTGHGAPFRLATLHVMTTLTGSALLGLAVMDGAVSAAEAWAKAHVDEDFEISRWGADAEATARRTHRWREMQAAAALAAAIPAAAPPGDSGILHTS